MNDAMASRHELGLSPQTCDGRMADPGRGSLPAADECVTTDELVGYGHRRTAGVVMLRVEGREHLLEDHG